jgi:spermidine synthase
VALAADRPKLALVAVLIAGVHPLLTETSDPLLFNDATYRRYPDLADGYAGFKRRIGKRKLLYFADGPHASVAVTDELGDLILRVNGKPDASTGRDMTTQTLVGHLPMLFHAAPRKVFLVGLGSGVTAGAVLAHEQAQLTVAEISEEVVEAQRFFESVNGRPLENPRTTLVVDDARTVMRSSDTRYDVIVSEPTNPWQAGVAGLFTVEFYDLVRARLNPGGVFMQWMHAYETNDALMSLVVATLLDRFAHVSVFEVGPSDFAFLAGDQPLDFTPTAFAARVAGVRGSLERVDAGRPFVLLATQVKSSESLRNDFPGAPVNSDDHPLLELRAPVAFFANQGSLALLRSDDRVHRRGRLMVDDWLSAHPLEAADVEGLARFARHLVSDVFRRSGLRLARKYLPAEHPVRVRATAQADAVSLLPWPPGDLGNAAWARLASQHYDNHFVRWAPVDIAPLVAALQGLDPARARPLGAALADAGCRHESREVCARLRGD